MSWFSVFLVLAFILVMLGSFLGAMMWLIENDGNPWMIAGGCACVLVHLACWAFLIKGVADANDDSSRREECEMTGGYWEQTGTRPILVGKVIVPQPVYGCVMP